MLEDAFEGTHAAFLVARASVARSMKVPAVHVTAQRFDVVLRYAAPSAWYQVWHPRTKKRGGTPLGDDDTLLIHEDTSRAE